jgi:hypothetical protein
MAYRDEARVQPDIGKIVMTGLVPGIHAFLSKLS